MNNAEKLFNAHQVLMNQQTSLYDEEGHTYVIHTHTDRPFFGVLMDGDCDNTAYFKIVKEGHAICSDASVFTPEQIKHMKNRIEEWLHQ